MRSAESLATGLIGRDPELRTLGDRIEAAARSGGGALLVRGGAGIGKSSLLDAARARGLASGLKVLATTGIESESRLPFAGLQQLLRPVLHEVDRLPDSYANAIRTSFGLSEQAPSHHLIALSTLHLLAECAETAPILLLVDDAHWLDDLTAGALAFVARRLESDPIAMVVALRDGFESPFLKARLAELNVVGLSDEDATALLQARAPGLAPFHRDRIL